jgi:hypothetical protein
VSVSLVSDEDNALAVSGHVISLHQDVRNQRILLSRIQIHSPQRTTHKVPTLCRADEVVQFLAVGRERRLVTVSLRRYLVLTMSIVDPDGVLTGTDGCEKRAAVGSKRDSLLFRCAGRSHLLRSAFRKALAPYVKSPARVGREIHPLSIG